jgi:hypothetical protein
MHFYINSSLSNIQRLTKMRSLTTPFQNLNYEVRDDKGLWCKGKRDRAAGDCGLRIADCGLTILNSSKPLDADPSPLPPSILPAWGFGMTRGCRSMGNGAGRHQILFFPRNILPPGPASPYRPPPCHPESDSCRMKDLHVSERTRLNV